MKPTKSIPELIPITAAAERLGMTRDGLHKARRAGNLSAVQLGRFWYVTPATLAEYRRWREARDGLRTTTPAKSARGQAKL